MYVKGFQCPLCMATYSFDKRMYQCLACGSNLEVIYDFSTLSVDDIKEQIYASERNDMFRYLPLLPLETTDMVSPLKVGWTPLYYLPRLNERAGLQYLYLKDETCQPSASFKDRAGAVVLAHARNNNYPVIAGASTGNAGSSMACLGASVGQPVIVFVPEDAPVAKLTQLLIYGAMVFAVRGTYDDAYDLCREACEHFGWYNRNTGYNPLTREGKKTCAYEICEQLNWQSPDWVVVPVGDGNIISGLWKGFKELHACGVIASLPRMLAVQSTGSNAIAETVHTLRASLDTDIDWSQVHIEHVQAKTIADSISVNDPRDGLLAVRAIIESGGDAVAIDDAAILSAMKELGTASGIFAEPAAACAWAGVKECKKRGSFLMEERIVCVITGNGLKDINAAGEAIGEPVYVDCSIDAVQQHIEHCGGV